MLRTCRAGEGKEEQEMEPADLGSDDGGGDRGGLSQFIVLEGSWKK